MKPLYEQAKIWETLRKGIEKGHWTIADLDKPPRGFIGDPAKYRNLLRDSGYTPAPTTDDLPF